MKTLEHLRDDPGITYWRYSYTNADLTNAPPKESRRHVRSLIISDVHFGTSACKAEALLATLNTFWIERYIILNGDIFHDLDFSRISDAQWNVISRIRKLTDPNIPLEEIWNRGNHDHATIKVFKNFLGISVRKEFIFTCGDKRYLIIHGDLFDRFVIDFPGLTKLFIWFHDIIQKLDPDHKHISNWLAKKIGKWRRESETIAERALQYGKKKNAAVVACGHTHFAMRITDKKTGMEYLNSGAWVSSPCSFITITEDGPVLNIVELS